MAEAASSAAFSLAVLVFAPILAALLGWLIDAPRVRSIMASATSVLLLAAMAAVTRQAVAGDGIQLALGGHAAPLGIELAVDGLSLSMLWLVQVVALAVNVYLAGWRHDTSAGIAKLLQVVWLLLWGGLNALFLSADLFNMYVTLEIISLAGVTMVAASGGGALHAAIRYLLFALVGSLFFLVGVSLVYAETGTLALRLLPESGPGSAAVIAMTLGLMIKAALFPVHGWLPAAHASAPAPASAVLSALVVPAAAYLLVRLWIGSFAGGHWSPALVQGLAILGTAGVVYASLQALRQQRLKLIVAYSTVAQLGYVLLLPALAGLLAWQGIIWHVVAHGFAKAGMFLAAGNIAHAIGDDRLENLTGLDRVLSGNLMVIAVCGVSLAGLPPTGGFIGKWWLASAALADGQWWWAVAVILGGLLTAAYVFRILAAGLRSPDSYAEDPVHRVTGIPAAMLWPPYLLAFMALALGVTGDLFAPMLAADVPGRVAS